MSKLKVAIVCAALLFLTAFAVMPLAAAIKAMNLEELMEISTGVMAGEIIAKDTVKLDAGDDPNQTFTRLTIRGQEMTTGESLTREIYYWGGIWNGKLDSPSTAPREHQTRVGARVVAFYWFDPNLTAEGAYKIFCFANIYQIQQGAGEPTVIGLGEGAAVPQNIKLIDLRAQIQAIHKKLEQKNSER